MSFEDTLGPTTEEGYQCARCGGQVEFIDCDHCEDGDIDAYEDDPINNSPGDVEPCSNCGGNGGWKVCGNSSEYCEAHPLPGRDAIKRGTIERFEVRRTR